METNTLCPDYASHSENAAERLFGRGLGNFTEAEMEQIDAEARAEYEACEGH